MSSLAFFSVVVYPNSTMHVWSRQHKVKNGKFFTDDALHVEFHNACSTLWNSFCRTKNICEVILLEEMKK